MNASNRIDLSSPMIPLSVVALLLGFMISLAWLRDLEGRSLSPDQRARIEAAGPFVKGDLDAEMKRLQDEVTKLRSENTRLQNAMAQETGQARVLNEGLQDVKKFAGLTSVTGPGVMVTLNDGQSKKDIFPEGRIIHYLDLLQVVNELWASGAEAISVNNNRVVSGTSFRCAGPVILVDTIRIATPIEVRAIGDRKTLIGALHLPGGVIEELKDTDPSMVKITTVDSMMLPAYSGPTAKRFIKDIKEAK